MMMQHEVYMYHTYVNSAKNEFFDQDAEKAFKQGGWMAVQKWVRYTGWGVVFMHTVVSMSDANKASEEDVPEFLILRLAFRSVIFGSMLTYRFRVGKCTT